MTWRALSICTVIAAFAGGFYAARAFDRPIDDQTEEASAQTETRQTGYTFINPLLECEQAEGRLNKRLKSFNENIKDLTSKKIDGHDIQDIAVYFRDLNNGMWFGIDEQDDFIPASLLKVPLMMNFYKVAELHPEILDLKIAFKQKFQFPNFAQTIPPSEEIQPGRDYTIEELIDHEIIHSDNQAAELLTVEGVRTLQENGYLTNQPYFLNEDLSLLDSFFGEKKDTVSVKNYATYFRVLFNASFLNRLYSERALALLSKAEYRDALVAGVPENVAVSHKFGEAGQFEGVREFHDCGIVYFPKHPYLLCVMTKGEDPGRLAPAIKDISRAVYEEVEKQVGPIDKENTSP